MKSVAIMFLALAVIILAARLLYSRREDRADSEWAAKTIADSRTRQNESQAYLKRVASASAILTPEELATAVWDNDGEDLDGANRKLDELIASHKAQQPETK